MTTQDATRLFDPRPALHDPFVIAATLSVVGLLVALPLIAQLLKGKAKQDVMQRWRGWLMLAPPMLLPVLFGAAWMMAATLVLALLCYREFARATGLFRERLTSAAVVIAILAVYFAALDDYYSLFVALWPLGVGLIALACVATDRPSGFIQRIGLGVLAFMLFGAGLGHLAFLGNDDDFRRIVLWLLIAVELNDVFAFTCGKLIGPLTGGRKLMPRTSPNKTLAGGIGAIVLTTLLAAGLGRIVWNGTELANWPHLLVLGVLIAVLGQAGDLLLSAVKRDLDLKDFGRLFPGHGGLLDRFDSLMLVVPAVFHYIGYVRGVGAGPERIFSAGWF